MFDISPSWKTWSKSSRQFLLTFLQIILNPSYLQRGQAVDQPLKYRRSKHKFPRSVDGLLLCFVDFCCTHFLARAMLLSSEHLASFCIDKYLNLALYFIASCVSVQTWTSVSIVWVSRDYHTGTRIHHSYTHNIDRNCFPWF